MREESFAGSSLIPASAALQSQLVTPRPRNKPMTEGKRLLSTNATDQQNGIEVHMGI
jgi:hypothetical protein